MYDNVDPDHFSFVFLSPPVQLGYSLDEREPFQTKTGTPCHQQGQFIPCDLYAWPVADNRQYMYKNILLIL